MKRLFHHNPTPGAADRKYLYGHIWVTLAWIVRHPLWDAIGLPLWAMLYVRLKNTGKIPKDYQWTFQTKLILAARLVEWAANIVQAAGKSLWITAHGAYAKRPFLRRAAAAGVVVVIYLHDHVTPRASESGLASYFPFYNQERVHAALD